MTNTGELVEIESSESNDDDNSSDSEETESDDDDDFIPDDAVLFNKNHLDSAKVYLQTLLKKKVKMTGNEKIYSMSAFNRYIDSSEDPYKLFHLDESDYFWLQIRRSDNEMSHIADIAMRLLASALSEASCESAISKQRLIHTDRRLTA